MKENRKLLKEVLKDIQHDMSDEEVLNLLADSKISERLSLEDWKRASSKDIPNGLQDTQFLINQKYCLFMFARNEKCYISICAYRLQAAERKIDVKVRNMGY